MVMEEEVLRDQSSEIRDQRDSPEDKPVATVGKPAEPGAGTASRPGKEREDELLGYDKQIEALKAAAAQMHIETPEEKQKRERREKSKKTIAAISDGLSAAANLYFTSQYAPNAYNTRESQIDKVNERIEALKAERQAENDRYTNFMLRIGDAENAKARTLREMQAQQEAQKLAREKAEHEAEAHNWKALLQGDKQREQKGKADKAEHEAASAQAEADIAPAMQQAKLRTEEARKGSYDASASASRASAASSMASARSHDRANQNEFSAWDKRGKEYKFKTKEAAERFAKQHGTWKEEDITSSTTTDKKDEVNGHSTQTATTVKKGGYPERPKPEDNTPPSRRGNNDNTPPSRRK